MIVQCEACQTRFRLADEKIKPGGTKVRCSKCKEIFTVSPPEPEPVEETVDFGSFNMEEVGDDSPAETASSSESLQTEDSVAEEQPSQQEQADEFEATDEPEGSDLDFSSLESEMDNNAGLGEELAEEFSFADTSQPVEDDTDEDDVGINTDFAIDDESQETPAADEATDFGAAFEETDESGESGDSIEFDFNDESVDDSATPESEEIDFSTEESAEPSEFSFESNEQDPQEQDEPGEFAFGDEGDDTAFSFDETEDKAAAAPSEEYSEPGEFSFDDETPFEDDSTTEWGDDSSGEDTSFDFDEPKFDTDDSPAEEPATDSGADDLQFGEIDFSSESEESEAPSFQSDDDFSKASMEIKEEPEPFSQNQQNDSPPERDFDDNEPLPMPPAAKKSSLSRILVLLILLLVILGGAAGFLFMQEGTLNLNTVTKYLPFLQEYLGEAPASLPGERIGINISGSSYVETKDGQMLVIQGAAVNNHPTARSAITVKGILIDEKGKTLLQQTVFCGNPLNDTALESMSFAAIEEAMNNQFGDGLSNMNVATGAEIPFTIVFRNLPAGIANINVEVVDSKPGAG